MKKISLLSLALLMVFGMGVSSFAAPVYNGLDGYVQLPRVDTPYTKRVALTAKYTYSSMFTPVLSLVPIDGLQLGMGWDIAEFQTGFNPLIASLQYQFYDKSAIGFSGEIPLNDAHRFYGTLYVAWEESFSASGAGSDSATFLVGYTFGNSSSINFGIGFQKSTFIDGLSVVCDFSNFPYRNQGWHRSHMNTDRGILNIGFRYVAADWLSIDFSGMDLFDSNRSFMTGLNFYL